MLINNTYHNSNKVKFTANKQESTIKESFIHSDRMIDSFISMAKIDTQSVKGSDISPSSQGQWQLGNILVEELKQIGLNDVKIDENCLITATLPDNLGENVKNKKTIALIAHLDTAPNVPSTNIQPVLHKNYQGGDIILNSGTVIPERELKNHKGEDIITSSGDTLIGIDDKGGIAEILEIMRIFKEHPEIKHPQVKIAFTPDEETGDYIDKFNIETLGADVAYTVDGAAPNCLDCNTFEYYKVQVKLQGIKTHSGYAKDKLINPIKLTSEFISLLPQKNESPETTEGFEGFYHPMKIEGNDQENTLTILLADFDSNKNKERIQNLKNIAQQIQTEHPGSKITVTGDEKPIYNNVFTYLEKAPGLVENAVQAIKNIGMTPKLTGTRGFTDGSTLSVKGLPTANLGSGQNNDHQLTEFASVQDMVKATRVIGETLVNWAKEITNQES